MLLELTLLSLLIPFSSDKPDKEYALLLETAEKKGWKVVRCSFRNFKTFFLQTKVYKVTFVDEGAEKNFAISVEDGNQHLLALLQAGYT